MPTFLQLRNQLPVGQTFAGIRESGRIYVDKTRYLYDLATSDQPWLLTRPRRFGKSTLVSAFEELFLHGVAPYDGHESYFKGLEIEHLWPQLPDNEGPFYVLHLDFGELLIDCQSVADFKDQLNEAIVQFASDAHLELKTTEGSKQNAFKLLLKAVPNGSLVLLVDEYDAPLTTLLEADDDAASKAMTKALRDFFLLVKTNSRKFRFTFITGITRLKDTSMFSVGNAIVDISQDPYFGAICGITREELQSYFPEHLRCAAAQWLKLPVEQVSSQQVEQLVNELAAWYDGYCFDSDGENHVFSLWSVLCFFRAHNIKFSPYWFEVSGQRQLRKILSQKSWQERSKLLSGESLQVGLGDFLSPSTLQTMLPEVLLFQAGYLTLKSPVDFIVSLGVPNKEIEIALTRETFAEFLPNFKEVFESYSTKLRTAVETHDAAGLQQCCNELLHGADYDHYPLTQESAIAFGLKLGISLSLHVRVDLNKHEALGRPDVLFDWQDTTVVIELKYAQTKGDTQKLLQQAVQQILDKKYGETYDRRQILWRLAMVFCAEAREITDVQVVSA
ncbi:MAG: ATP-binding protein [Candidatus Anaerobiospirillum pullicola]|uniref:ATP-binding protein n=1 Tax=Candidatus Anaerobiospirillum pullicola TaxID=2838451 RepID=A0A948TIJ9_9GAMM|nr:ATP-binding protein [Candidatus Anaerobiospirillum pullicola]